jgi:hypothetical protein
MDHRPGSSGRAPSLQAQSPEFKLQSYQKIKTSFIKIEFQNKN